MDALELQPGRNTQLPPGKLLVLHLPKRLNANPLPFPSHSHSKSSGWIHSSHPNLPRHSSPRFPHSRHPEHIIPSSGSQTPGPGIHPGASPGPSTAQIPLTAASRDGHAAVSQEKPAQGAPWEVWEQLPGPGVLYLRGGTEQG